MATRTRVSRATLATAAAMVLLLACLPLSVEAPEPDPSPLLDIDLIITPSSLMVFPQDNRNLKVGYMGSVRVSKARPVDTQVHLTCTIDTGWAAWMDPMTLYFTHVGDEVQTFSGYTAVPPNIIGPSEVHLTVRAWSNMTGRTVEDTEVVLLIIVTNTDQFLTNLDSLFTVQRPDMEMYSRVTVSNLRDQELEFHIGAVDDWEEKIPDLDFNIKLVLGPMETRDVSFHGTLPGDTEPGEYRIPLGLWTPGLEGERVYITKRNVTVSVIRPFESEFESIQYLILLVTILAVVPISCVIFYWMYATKHRWKPWRTDPDGPAEAPRDHPSQNSATMASHQNH